MMQMGWVQALCVFGCHVAAVSRIALAPLHAQLVPTTVSAMTLVVDGHPCMAAIQPPEVIEWLRLQLN